MSDETKPDETKPDAAAAAAATPAAKPARTVKVGDTVHLVHHTGATGARFAVAHAEAEVRKVYQKGKFVDLIAHHEDPTRSLTITSAPRDDEGKQLDSWHFPEAAQ